MEAVEDMQPHLGEHEGRERHATRVGIFVFFENFVSFVVII
jgi:hypothetical protein